jgi:small-conductance mechanosensitive channel
MVEENVDNVSMKESKNSFMERLQEASTELGSVKSSFSKGMEDLAKIQSMLSLDGLDKMDSMIRSFENRLSESERRREEAAEGARRYSMELEKEKERLVKLWDAYKNQEESLSAQEKRVVELEEKLRDTEQVHMQFERDATARIHTLTEKINEREQAVEQIEDMKQQVMRFDNIRTQMETNIDGMRSDLITKDDTIRGLEKQVEELRGFEQFVEFKTKFEETSTELDKEKERLTKLFRLYEETESENKQLKEDLHGWQSWFNSNEALFTKLFSSVDQLKHSNMNKSAPAIAEEEIESSQEVQPETIERPKRKILFRK